MYSIPQDAKVLPMDINTFGFVTREKKSGRTVANRCGRDFLYYAFSYYFPEEFNRGDLNPVEIERRGLFGMRLPHYLRWTGLSFSRVPRLIREYGLEFAINYVPITSYASFIQALAISRLRSFEEGLRMIRRAVDSGYIAGVDIPISFGGLVDHVMFVYGYDQDNVYVFDTYQSARVPYIKLTRLDSDYFIMKLPLSEIKRTWGRFSRVWTVKRTSA